MKVLILFLVFSSFAFAQTNQNSSDTGEILSDQELGQKFVSAIQGAKLEDQLVGSGEFKTCADQFKFDPKQIRSNQVLDQGKAKQLADCFDNVLKGKPAAKIQELSDTLNLQGYQLVRGKTVKDITSYLTNQVYKRMTGIDLQAKTIADQIKSQSFNSADRKIVDQRDFAELYRIQLGKSALYEISRFCFVNLRNTAQPETDFVTHWTDTLGANKTPGDYLKSFLTFVGKNVDSVKGLTDSPKQEFGSVSGTDEATIYRNIQTSFAGPSNTNFGPKTFQNFFEMCMLTIAPLCNQYKKSTEVTGSAITSSTSSSSKTNITDISATKVGGNACITQARLQDIRRGMNNTKLVLQDFDSLKNAPGSAQIKLEKNAKNYNSADAADGFNSISTITSKDILSGSTANETANDCINGTKKGDDCKGFVVEDDSLKQALHDTDVNLRLKTELEVKNIQELYTDKAGLEKFLTDKGYFDLLKVATRNPPPTADVFALEVRNMFDARRLAAIQAIQDKAGKRQVDSKASDQEKSAAVNLSAKAASEERGRLAQVVLFTNIVTSSLELKRDDGSGKKTISLGSNDYALKKEQGAGGLDNQFFTTGGTGSGGSSNNKDSNDVAATSNNFLQDISFLDQVIGKDAAP